MPPFAALPFFLNADEGERFCLYHEPEAGMPPRGAILHVHPFAEELNKSRRMVALQARAYAQAGFGVLQIDLFGCGDSSGEFAQARWDIWLNDLARAWQWMRKRHTGPGYLWGLRLGALLALDFATRAQPDGLILWQPALSGRAYLNQFARLQSAARLFSGAPAVEQDNEIAGYAMSPALADTIGQLDVQALAPRCPVQWLELSSPPQDAAAEYAAAAGNVRAALQPASALVIDRWRQSGARVQAIPVHGQAFWASNEIGIVPELLAATTAAAPGGAT
ncbi:hydrolase 2, exosortase A system-associated [Pseudoduganella sp. FT25W]|uniref:Hydrolase 2, exosortase A system-associated n=2 Tax=Duganella alba TaxID=2666081 RepID=A0A6L5QBE0_9BURK|nr:hydrolase 2, exosortase A system-associated [Duganella alba]MRX14825.1 hydrolase 2, exosortase A system-associated [Duganella alba]